MKKVLVTCPPMLAMIDEFTNIASEWGLQLVGAETTQVLSEQELIQSVPEYEGWIIGDDPATRKVFEAGVNGRLRAAVKWGIGVDNVDFEACRDLQIPITNTPNMFGGEVADLAMAYLLGLSRSSYFIDREIRQSGTWPKPAGLSMEGKVIGVVGFGDIGFNLVRRLSGFGVRAVVYDPGVSGNRGFSFVERANFPDRLEELDALILTCALNEKNRHMLNESTFSLLKVQAFVINVARGALISEPDLIEALQSGRVAAAALDVFETEPLPADSPLRGMPFCVFGSHNGSNTVEGVRRATEAALAHMRNFLE